MPRFVYKLKRSKITEEHEHVPSHLLKAVILPPKFDLRQQNPSCVPDILDQGQLGSCAPNELSNAVKFCLAKENLPVFQPSRLYIYYFSRMLDNSSVGEDTGIMISSGIQCLRDFGAPPETLQPYDISTFTQQPPSQAIEAAFKNARQFKAYLVKQDLNSIKQAICSGFPVVYGMSVYSSLESQETISTGNIPMPDPSTEQLLGGHCCALYGYDDTTKTFIMMNSWGKNVGQNGYFHIPYDYILNPDLTSELWCITLFKE